MTARGISAAGISRMRWKVIQLEARLKDAEKVIDSARKIGTEVTGVEDGYQFVTALDAEIDEYERKWGKA